MPPKKGYNHNHRPCSYSACPTSSVGRWSKAEFMGTCPRVACLKKVSRLLPGGAKTEARFKYIAEQVAVYNKEPEALLDKDIHAMCLAMRERVAKAHTKEKAERKAKADEEKAKADEAKAKRRAEMEELFKSEPNSEPNSAPAAGGSKVNPLGARGGFFGGSKVPLGVLIADRLREAAEFGSLERQSSDKVRKAKVSANSKMAALFTANKDDPSDFEDDEVDPDYQDSEDPMDYMLVGEGEIVDDDPNDEKMEKARNI